MLLSNVKQIYFTLDYLRLHRLGRKLKLFNKNRQMLDPTSAEDVKKGYKAYIHRMYHTFLKHDFNYVTVVKPRNEFGYNFGPTDNQLNSHEYLHFNIFKKPENLLLYAYRRYFFYKENEDLIQNYTSSFVDNKYVKPRTKGMFYTVRLDPVKSGGYEAMRELYKTRDAQLKIIEKFNDEKIFEESMQKSIAAILNKIRKVKVGQTVLTVYRNGAYDATSSAEIQSIYEKQNGEGFIEYIDLVVNGRSFSLKNTLPIFTNQSQDIANQIEQNKILKQDFYSYVLKRLETSENFTVTQVFNLSKAFYKIEKSLSDADKTAVDSFNDFDFFETLSPEQKNLYRDNINVILVNAMQDYAATRNDDFIITPISALFGTAEPTELN
jgi:hypothetical protein